MQVQFREFNPFDLWVWLEFDNVLSPGEQAYIEELFNSWFYMGKLGAFNAENLQVQDAGIDLNYLEYDSSNLQNTMMAPMHNMSDFKYQGSWGRCWFDLGTSDLIGLDILINALNQLSNEYVPVRQLIIGGINEDWPVAAKPDLGFDEFDDN